MIVHKNGKTMFFVLWIIKETDCNTLKSSLGKATTFKRMPYGFRISI